MLQNFVALTFNSSSCQMIEVQIDNISLVSNMNSKDDRLSFLKSNVFFLYLIFGGHDINVVVKKTQTRYGFSMAAF
jgi:hypothetical protein